MHSCQFGLDELEPPDLWFARLLTTVNHFIILNQNALMESDKTFECELLSKLSAMKSLNERLVITLAIHNRTKQCIPNYKKGNLTLPVFTCTLTSCRKIQSFSDCQLSNMVVRLTDISRSSLYTKFLERNSIVSHFSIFLSEYERDNGIAKVQRE